MFRMTGHLDVDTIGQLNITGNVTPQSWYQHIRYTNKRGNYPDLLAITILSDIVYWHRPVEVRDEATLHIVGWRKKFKDDMLQRSPEVFAQIYGVSLKQVRSSLKLLKELGLINIELRPVKTAYGTIPNTMFIGANSTEIMRITYQLNPETIEKSLLPNSASLVAEFGTPCYPNGQHPLPKWATSPAQMGNNTIYRDYSENTHTQDDSKKPVESVCVEDNEKSKQKSSQRKKSKPQVSQPPTQALDLFDLWKEKIDLQTWNDFLAWKATQAPSKVRDHLGWAYNTLKADLERAQLSFQSFQQETQQTQSSSKDSAVSDFTTWNKAQHLKLAQQYRVEGIEFLKENSWHRQWVEFIDTNFPTYFDEIQE